ncbi:unnamed protein product [Haemonchus placei]|uniref:Aquaporin n=1 Tax=Haemonchus placei TaxID=6290 RepID=A0A0N4WK62_HAEPC|nr:unnamed protein product [Haemonchus placei]
MKSPILPANSLQSQKAVYTAAADLDARQYNMSTIVTVGNNTKAREAFTERGNPMYNEEPETNTISEADGKIYPLWVRCAAEFLGVMMFVFVGSCQGLTTYDGVLHAAFTHGFCIFVNVATFAHISGAHVNPAVTVGIAAARKISPLEALFYIISQMCGAVVGGLWVRSVLSYPQYVAIQGGATLCAPQTAWYQGLIAEALCTYFLMQTIFMTAVDGTTVLAPLAIGSTVLMDIMAA